MWGVGLHEEAAPSAEKESQSHAGCNKDAGAGSKGKVKFWNSAISGLYSTTYGCLSTATPPSVSLPSTVV